MPTITLCHKMTTSVCTATMENYIARVYKSNEVCFVAVLTFYKNLDDKVVDYHAAQVTQALINFGLITSNTATLTACCLIVTSSPRCRVVKVYRHTIKDNIPHFIETVERAPKSFVVEGFLDTSKPLQLYGHVDAGLTNLQELELLRSMPSYTTGQVITIKANP